MKDPKIQNIPIRTKTGRSIREAFVPKNGLFVGEMVGLFANNKISYSQIEIRLLEHMKKNRNVRKGATH